MLSRLRSRSVLALVALIVIGCTTPAASNSPAPATGGPSSSPATSAEPSATASAATAYPVTVASCGRDFLYDEAPSRVIVAFPPLLDIFVALGIEDTVSGLAATNSTDVPAGFEDVEVINPQELGPKEAILGATPDLIVAAGDYHFAEDRGAPSYDELAQNDTNVYVLEGECGVNRLGATIEGSLLPDIENLGTIFGVTERASEVVDELQARIDAVRERVDGRTVPVAVVESAEGLIYANANILETDGVTIAGGENVFADLEQAYGQVSKEAILERAPELVIVWYYKEADKAAVLAEAQETFAGTPLADKIIALSVSANVSVRFIETVEAVADALFPS